jgi:hypothetical protein
MNLVSNKLLLAIILIANIIFIVVVWILDKNFLVNTGFLVLGALLAIITSFMNELHQRTLRAQDLARVLHTELADLVARCCFDSEAPWRQYWGPNPPGQAFNVIRLRKFAPGKPVIFSATVGELALLAGNASLLLMQFHYRLNALRREIDNIADDSTEATRVEPISLGALRQVGSRIRQTLEPGLKALEALAHMVPDANQIEAFAIAQYDATRDGAPPAGTLRDRINVLLELRQ